MKIKPIFLDFLNREATRASGRKRSEALDLDILRTLCIALPYGFSANISQLAEYGNSKPELFENVMKLIASGVIDATSSAGTLDEFIDDHQQRYSHVPDRYPFYFSRSGELQEIRLGTRNQFSMTDVLGQHLLNYNSGRFQFDLVRAHDMDRVDFESGLKSLVQKVMNRENLAITRDLLEADRGGAQMTAPQIAATSRIFSALYMKIYAERLGLSTCTGIPDFAYKEIPETFPSFDYPVLKRVIVALGGYPLLYQMQVDQVIASYRSQDHQHFAYYLQAYLASAVASIKAKVNDPNSLVSMRALFDQFCVRNLDGPKFEAVIEIEQFYRDALALLFYSSNQLQQIDPAFLEKWRTYVPEATNGLVVITTATDSEDEALFAALKQNGFERSRVITTGVGVAREFSRNYSQRLVHVRTRAGSLGVNSAGGVLPPTLNSLNARFVISAGICFGLRPAHQGVGKQNFGDILISSEIQDYETVRQGAEVRVRGDKLPAGPGLLQAVRIAKDEIDRSQFKVHEGTILSGQKLVDDPEFIENLRKIFPEAIGGEMEGNALATAAIYEGRQWIVIKGICDWGMEKEDGWQAIAAERACQLAVKAAIIMITAEQI